MGQCTLEKCARKLASVLVAVVALPTGASGCSLRRQVLEYKDVGQFSIEEVRYGKARSLRLSGLAFHSALAIDGHEEVMRGDELRVRIFLRLARRDMSGTFDFVVDIPCGVREVRFGDEGHRIWPA